MRCFLKLTTTLGIVSLAALILLGCSENQKLKQVSLSMLANSNANYNNTQVITSGRVRRFEDPLHYWIEDENLNRVEILPYESVSPFLGQMVLVQGRFSFSASEGRKLILTNIKRQ